MQENVSSSVHSNVFFSNSIKILKVLLVLYYEPQMVTPLPWKHFLITHRYKCSTWVIGQGQLKFEIQLLRLNLK